MGCSETRPGVSQHIPHLPTHLGRSSEGWGPFPLHGPHPWGLWNSWGLWNPCSPSNTQPQRLLLGPATNLPSSGLPGPLHHAVPQLSWLVKEPPRAEGEPLIWNLGSIATLQCDLGQGTYLSQASDCWSVKEGEGTLQITSRVREYP